MSRLIAYLPGPELIWLALYGIVSLIARANVPPDKAIDDRLEYLCYYVPLAAFLTFGLWYFPGVEKNWLLLRVWIACVFGGHYVLEKGLGAHSQQGPGIGTAYIVGMIFVFFALIVGSIFVKIRF
jgi:hypothetical protein